MFSAIADDPKHRRLLDELERELDDDTPGGYQSKNFSRARELEEAASEFEFVRGPGPNMPPTERETGLPRYWSTHTRSKKTSADFILPPNPYTPSMEYDRRYRTSRSVPKVVRGHTGSTCAP